MFDWLNGVEISFLDFIQDNLRFGALDSVMRFFTALGDGGAFFIGAAVLLLLFKKTRRIGVAIGISLLLQLVIVSVFMKPAFFRTRPYDFVGNPQGGLLISPPEDYSFPSGHTASAFAFAFSVLAFNKRLGIPALLIAAAVSVSRLYLYVHYPSDVIAGIIIGIVSSRTAVRIVEYGRARFGRERFGRKDCKS